jgi:hypothetical protein
MLIFLRWMQMRPQLMTNVAVVERISQLGQAFAQLDPQGAVDFAGISRSWSSTAAGQNAFRRQMREFRRRHAKSSQGIVLINRR